MRVAGLREQRGRMRAGETSRGLALGWGSRLILALVMVRVGKVCGIVLGFLGAGVLLGCEGSPPAKQADGNTHMQSLMEGEWFPEMPKDKLRVILMTELALKTPPDEASFSKMLPTLQEHDQFAAIVRRRTDDFNAKDTDELRKTVHDFEDSVVRVTPTRLEMKDDQDGQRKFYFYKLKWEDVNNITIFCRGDLMEWKFTDHNHVTIVAGEEKTPLVRREGLIADATR